MKKVIVISILALLTSCSKSSKLNGSWYFTYNNDTEAPRKITIQEDSIVFHYSYINLLERHALKIESSHLYFKNFKIPYEIIGDTLLIAERQVFTRQPLILHEEMPDFDPMIEIDLPQLNQSRVYNNQIQNAYFKYFGINPETEQYALLINDMFLDNFEDYLLSIDPQSNFVDYLLVDKNTKMSELETLFLASKLLFQLKVVLVNDIRTQYENNVGIEFKYYAVRKTFSQFACDSIYFKNLAETLQFPESPILPPQPPNPPNFITTDYPKPLVIELINNTLYFQNEKINSDQLKTLLNDAIDHRKPIISPYDFDSNYESFLSLNLEIYSALYKKRQALAIEKFNKNYSELDKEGILQVKEALPMIHFWDYSILHFNEVIKKDGTFYGLRI